jgi:hypothetical protein
VFAAFFCEHTLEKAGPAGFVHLDEIGLRRPVTGDNGVAGDYYRHDPNQIKGTGS